MTDVISPPEEKAETLATLLTGYATERTFLASRFTQGSRTVFSFDLSLSEVLTLIDRPDPEVASVGNRQIKRQHAIEFGKYVRDNKEWVAPPLILRTSDKFEFETQFDVGSSAIGVLHMPLSARTQLHILDGQHRILGFFDAADRLRNDIDMAASLLASARREDPKGPAVRDATKQLDALKAQQKRMDSERIAVQVYVEADTRAYRQMFADMADNQIGISGSVRARFDTRKVVNRVLAELMDTTGHPLLNELIDPERPRVRGNSPYFISALGVANIIRAVNVGFIGRYTNRAEAEARDDVVLKNTVRFLDNLTTAFPLLEALGKRQIRPSDVRDHSLLGSPLFLKMLAGVQHSLITEHAFTNDMVIDFFKQLNPHMEAPVVPGGIWEHAPEGSIAAGWMQPNGRKQESAQLAQALVDWAIEKPAFLNADAPVRAIETPVAVEDMSEEQIDAELRPETAQARKARDAAAPKQRRAGRKE